MAGRCNPRGRSASRASGATCGPFSFRLGCLLKKRFLLLGLLFLATPAVAYDFGAAATVAALGIGGAALALVFGAPAALGTVAIGAIVAGIQFASPSNTGTDAMQVQLSPSAQLATPDGWTPPASGQVEPTPPSSATGTTGYKMGTASGGYIYPTADAACHSYGYASAGPNGICYFANGDVGASSWVSGTSCPTGYLLSGTSCVISDPSIVPKPSDGVCTIKRTGNSFGVDPRDPDCASGKIPATVAVGSNSITMQNADGTTKGVTINSDGSSTVTESRPNYTTNTTETNTTNFSAPDASGQVKVTGQGQGAIPGTGSLAGTGTSTTNVTFDKSGLATEGTLGGIKSDTGAIKDALTKTDGVDTSSSSEKSAFDSAVDSISAMFGDEPNKTSGLQNDFSVAGLLPTQCGCVPLTIDYKGHHASFDWCSPMEVIKGALAWVIGFLTAFYILSLFRVGGGK